MLYRDRVDAGEQLSKLLGGYRDKGPFVLGLPRGGVVVGYQIALALDAPLDVLVVRKLGAPFNPEFGFGAIGPGGVRYLDEGSVLMLGLSAGEIEQVAQAEAAEMDRRIRSYRGDRPEPDLTGKSVILVDDGLATGVTARAAIRVIRRARPACVVLAVPVAPIDTAEALRQEVDDLVCPVAQANFHAISQWYEHFDQTTDREVLELLRSNRDTLAGQG